MALGTAIRHLKKGEWEKAHSIVQQDETKLGCWAHGIVHIVEGDLGNARYWYRRAGRPFPKDRDVDSEVAALAGALKKAEGARRRSCRRMASSPSWRSRRCPTTSGSRYRRRPTSGSDRC